MAHDAVYIGVWKNHSYDKWILTLGLREGGFLITALVIWISLCAMQFWNLVKVLVYIVSAAQAESDRDLFYYQRQALLRNSSGGAATAYVLAQLSWSWRKQRRARLALRVAFVLIIICLLEAAAWYATAFFTSYIYSKSGPDVLLRSSSRCGFYGGSDSSGVLTSELEQTNTAAQYVRQCYNSELELTFGSCVNYPVTSIPFQGSDTDCPFNSANCIKTNSTPYQLDTGYIDTSTMLGIEAEEKDRVLYRKVVQCSPAHNFNVTSRNVTMEEYRDSLQGLRGFPGNIVYNFHIGPLILGPSGKPATYNTFQVWDTSPDFPFPYSISTYFYFSGNSVSSQWLPNSTFFNRKDTDLAMFFMTPNNVSYSAPNYDPVFTAGLFPWDTFLSEDQTIRYRPSYLNGIIACTEQHQFCKFDDSNPTSCTPFQGAYQVAKLIAENALGFNAAQIATMERIYSGLPYTTLYNSVFGREASSLLASDTLYANIQTAALPNDQWRIEVANWFAISLAKLQANIITFATGPPDISSYKQILPTGAGKQQCGQQRVRRQQYQNFDMTAIVIVVVIGFIIIVAGQGLEPGLNLYYKHVVETPVWRQWRADGIFQLQKRAFEAAGVGNWDDTAGAVPTSQSKLLPTSYEKSDGDDRIEIS